ncbi:hypothetical protein BDA96_03G408300 [Sorghum bicolor]|uniref:Uncharacterized protein n=1 Tax=Sorghum bicolor TaxID=4558 RepID=A0A921URC3_SORBI|nr:hypothetical protein BDA96_03G408300 [Sorghum bicolor]
MVRASPADYLNPLPILYLGSGEQKNALQQAIYLSTYFCWPNKFSLPLPRSVGPTNMPTYSLPRSSLSRTRTHATRPHCSTAALQPSLLAALHPGGAPPAPLSSSTQMAGFLPGGSSPTAPPWRLPPQRVFSTAARSQMRRAPPAPRCSSCSSLFQWRPVPSDGARARRPCPMTFPPMVLDLPGAAPSHNST